MTQRIFRIIVVLWAGSLWSLAAWVAPTLFLAQHDRHLAGVLAARLFSIETYVGLLAAAAALCLPLRRKFKCGFAAAALLALGKCLLTPVMARALEHGTALGLSFGSWHGIYAVAYLMACGLVACLVWNDDLR